LAKRLKLYEKIEGAYWKPNPTDERPFTLSALALDYDKYYQVRYLQFDEDLKDRFFKISFIGMVIDPKGYSEEEISWDLLFIDKSSLQIAYSPLTIGIQSDFKELVTNRKKLYNKQEVNNLSTLEWK
jgi:hypothetical protein